MILVTLIISLSSFLAAYAVAREVGGFALVLSFLAGLGAGILAVIALIVLFSVFPPPVGDYKSWFIKIAGNGFALTLIWTAVGLFVGIRERKKRTG